MNGIFMVLCLMNYDVLSATPTGNFHDLQDKISDSIGRGENLTLGSNDYYMHSSMDSETEITIDVPSQLLPFVIMNDIRVFYSGDDKYLPNNATATIKVLSKEDKNKTSHKKVHESVKSGLERYETGNPIFVLLMVLSILGVSIKRRK